MESTKSVVTEDNSKTEGVNAREGGDPDEDSHQEIGEDFTVNLEPMSSTSG